jgi:putative transposase
MSKESGRIYTKALLLNNKYHKSLKEINKEMEKYIQEDNNRKYLLAQSAQASYQSLIKNFKSYFAALKEFKKNPKKFSGEPKPPRKSKFMYKIVFKQEAIRIKDGNLLLSVKKPHEPIKIRWASTLPLPKYVEISYNRFEGWNISFVMDKEYKELSLDKNKIMSTDLGEIRTATTFNNVDNEVKTYSGKALRSLTRLRNKVNGKIQSKKSQYKKGSRKHKKIARAGRKIIKRIRNKQKNILHKQSRIIVNDAISKNIGTILIGDCSSIHNKTDLGKNNQKVQQNLEQRLKDFINYKFERVGGTTNVIPEYNTSRTCPKCGHCKHASPTGRTYVCEICDFTYDRDGVGSIGIMQKNVSFDHDKWLDVVGGLTPPIGVKLKNVESRKNEKIQTPRLSLAFEGNFLVKKIVESKGSTGPYGLEEPHEL